eukprot:gb/GFBE01008917.1/.p1 GENE.gb/GFBE01008917.1/~~gb/GFBE01008917.1/.p1  ORF type:complete len:127 (+),score=19.35 gb/GFBE01008917.1/:1-381(+)
MLSCEHGSNSSFLTAPPARRARRERCQAEAGTHLELAATAAAAGQVCVGELEVTPTSSITDSEPSSCALRSRRSSHDCIVFTDGSPLPDNDYAAGDFQEDEPAFFPSASDLSLSEKGTCDSKPVQQ